MFKRLLGKKARKGEQQQAQPAAVSRPPAASDNSDAEEDYDDEGTHEMQLQQEEYLLHMALAASAKEYQRNGRPADRPRQRSSSSRGTALAQKYWNTGM